MALKFIRYNGCFDGYLVTEEQKQYIEQNCIKSKFHQQDNRDYLLTDFCSSDTILYANKQGIIYNPSKRSFN